MLIFLGVSRIFNDRSRKYCSESGNKCIITGKTVKTPAVHAVSNPIHCKNVLARARELAGT